MIRLCFQASANNFSGSTVLNLLLSQLDTRTYIYIYIYNFLDLLYIPPKLLPILAMRAKHVVSKGHPGF
nr:hypothetical protein CFP56_28967 [Quercus suber]